MKSPWQVTPSPRVTLTPPTSALSACLMLESMVPPPISPLRRALSPTWMRTLPSTAALPPLGLPPPMTGLLRLAPAPMRMVTSPRTLAWSLSGWPGVLGLSPDGPSMSPPPRMQRSVLGLVLVLTSPSAWMYTPPTLAIARPEPSSLATPPPTM